MHRASLREVRLHSLRSKWCSSDYLFFTGETKTPTVPVETLPEWTDAEKLARLWAAHSELHYPRLFV